VSRLGPFHVARRRETSESLGFRMCICRLPRLLRGVAREIAALISSPMFALSLLMTTTPMLCRLEDFLVPAETEVDNELAQLLAISDALLSLHCNEEYADFVTPQRRPRVPSAYVVLEAARAESRRLSPPCARRCRSPP